MGNFESYKIPIPPPNEQKQIAEILDRAEELRSKRRDAIAQLDTLTQAIFIEIFGDPQSNPKNWSVKFMAALFATSPIFGTMIPPVKEKLGWLSLRVGNIQNWNLDLSDRKYVDLPPESIARHSVKDGDLLLARAIASQDHLGKCVVADPSGENWAFDLYLAVSEATYSDIFSEPIGKLAIAQLPLKLIIVDLEKKEVSQWIPS